MSILKMCTITLLTDPTYGDVMIPTQILLIFRKQSNTASQIPKQLCFIFCLFILLFLSLNGCTPTPSIGIYNETSEDFSGDSQNRELRERDTETGTDLLHDSEDFLDLRESDENSDSDSYDGFEPTELDPPQCVPATEICDGLDNDCNEHVDDMACSCTGNLECYGGPPQTVGLGECQNGTRTCNDGGEFFGPCSGWIGPEREECDGLDNDCDGEIDEFLVNDCGDCGAAPEEICDYIDNDCDGNIDEGVNNACGECGELPIEICDYTDNNCNGEIDEGLRNACDECGDLPEEICDFIDNDCDGQVDEHVRNRCDGCGPEPQEICEDELDNNCDGQINEGCCTEEEICGDGIDNECNGLIDDLCPQMAAEQFVVGEITETLPVDYIMIIDNSTSMEDTINEVTNNLHQLALRLSNDDIDFMWILIASRGTTGTDVCIQPPMASGNCGDTERFHHFNERVGSHNAFQKIIECNNGCGLGYHRFLRSRALTQVIVVTDDESNTTWENFVVSMAHYGIDEFVLHSIVGIRNGGCVESLGESYIQGSNETGGELFHICDNDWGQVISGIFESTVTRLQGTFLLQNRPVVDTLRVFSNAPGGPEQEHIDNWIYDELNNSISFLGNTTPPEGHTVTFRYEYI